MSDLFAGKEVEQHVGHGHAVVELNPVVLQVAHQRENQRFILVVTGELERRQVGQAANVMQEAMQVELHLQSGVPFLKGEHGLPVHPEIRTVEFVRENIVDRFVVQGFIGGKEQL